MNKILLDGEEVTQFVTESLPILIHGNDGSGASLYTVSLATNFYAHGFQILFLCGYPMAEEEFAKQINNFDREKVIFYTQEKIEKFKEKLIKENINSQVIVIKNIELFRKDIFDLVANKQNIIISGDINKSTFKQELRRIKFTTEIYFSPFEDIKLLSLNKYEGRVISGKYRGVTSLELS